MTTTQTNHPTHTTDLVRRAGRAIRPVLAFMTLCLLLAGCFQVTHTAEPYSHDATTTTASPSIDVASRSDSGDNNESWDSLINGFVPYDLTDAGATDEYYRELEHEFGRRVAACMREQGFVYTPAPMEGHISVAYHETELPRGSDEWIAKYGFGVSTLAWSQWQVGPDLTGYPADAAPDPESFSDPNLRHLESLTEAERDAWDQALYGTPEAGETGLSYPFGGCQLEHWDDVYGEANAFASAFGDELATLYDRIDADPRVRAFHDRINGCVAAAGYEWDNSREPWEHFAPKLMDIGSDLGQLLDSERVETMTMTEREAAFEATLTLSPSDRARLAEVQAEERELAAAVVNCGGGEQATTTALGEIWTQYEVQFVADHQQELGAFAVDA